MDKKFIDLGLKQGCVMSPILFSLYLADLGRLLERSGMGVQVGEKKIPGLFFADDIIIWEEEKRLQQLLDILAKYASEWQLQFSAEKSVVIPMSRPPSVERTWRVGFHPNTLREEFMNEVEKAKYLGITFQWKHCVYKPHLKELRSKLQFGSSLVRALLGPINNNMMLIKNLWEIYVRPAITYGISAIGFPNHYITELEKMERGALKILLKLPQYVKNETVYVSLRMLPLGRVINRDRLNYRNSILLRQKAIWMKEALKTQELWCVQEGWMQEEDRLIRGCRITGNSTSFFVKEIIKEAQMDVQYMDRVLALQSKKYINMFCMQSWFRLCERLKRESSTMAYVDEPTEPPDVVHNKSIHGWWMRCKLGAVFLRHRGRGENRECVMCGHYEENMAHFVWECGEYDRQDMENILPDELGEDVGERMRWTFSSERNSHERMILNDSLKRMWKRREEKLTDAVPSLPQ